MGMWKSLGDFQGAWEEVGIRVLDFHAFHARSFPRALLAPQPAWRFAMELVLERVYPADHQRAVQHLLITLVTSAQAEPFPAERLAHKHALALKFQIAFFRNPAHRHIAVIRELRHAPRERPIRALITTGRRPIFQRFMRPSRD